MAESIVKIKLQADTSGIGDIQKKFDGLNTELEKLSKNTSKMSEGTAYFRTLQQQNAKAIQDTVDRINALTTKQNQQLKTLSDFYKYVPEDFTKKLYDAKVVKDFSRELDPLIAKLERLQKISREMPAKEAGITRAKNTLANVADLGLLRDYYTQLEAESRLKRQEYLANIPKPTSAFADFAAKEKAILAGVRQSYQQLEEEKLRTAKQYNDFIAQYEKARVERITSETKRMYAAMFDEIAAKEVATQERAARINAARKTADSRGYTPFAYGTVGQVREAEQAKIDAARKSRTVDFGKTITDTGIYKPASDYSNAMIAGMSKSYREIATTQKEVTANTSKVIEKHREWHNSLAEVIAQYRVINYVYNLFLNSIKSIPSIGIELEATKAILMSTVGSEAGMSSVLKALDEEAQRTGLSLASLRENFRLFQASTSLAGESLQDTWRMFTNINTVSTSLHLSTDKTIGVFTALAQIFNKSKVQSEELVKQLGNLLPGAFASFQKANKEVYGSTQELIAQMKKGMVFAHDTVLNFTDFLRDRFAASFAVASTGLNSNIGRMQTSFTHLGETIYGLSSGPLNAAVKGITNLANSFNDSLKDGRDMLDMLDNLASVMGGVLVAAMFKAASTAKVLQTSLLAIGGNAVLVALGAVITKMQIIGQNQSAIYEDAKQRLEAFKGQTEVKDLAKPLEIRVENSEEVKKAKDQLAGLRQELLEVQKAAAKGASTRYVGGDRGIIPIGLAESELKINIAEQKDLITKTIEAQTLAIKKADQDAINNIVTNGVSIADAAAQLRVDAIRATEGDVAGALANWDKLYKDKVKAAELGIDKAKNLLTKVTDPDVINNLKEQIKANEQFLKDAEIARKFAGEKVEAKANKNKATQAYRTDLQETKAAFEQYKTDIASTLGVLDNLYQESQLSIQEYFTRKLALQRDDISVQRQMLESEKALAVAKGDTAKAAQLDYEIRKLNTKATKEEYDNQLDLNKALIDYRTSLQEIRAAELISQGKGAEGAVEKFKTDNAKVYAQALRDSDTEALSLLKTRELTIGLEQNLKNLEQEKQLAQQKYNLELDKVNTKVSAGIMGQFQAMSELTKANEDYLKVKEAEYAKMLQFIREVEAGGGAVPPKDRLEAEQLNNEIEKLQLNANEFANFFAKEVGDSFANAFTEFAKGTKTAKEAFRDMAASIVEDLTKMAAQEAATQLLTNVLKPLGGAALGGLTGLFAANGAAVTGMSSVSGSVLSKATYFPSAKPVAFASGGVVAGEAGAEAVLPLKRNKAGKLGVVLENSGQSAGNVYNIAVTVKSSDNESPAGMGEKIAISVMRSIAKEEVANAGRSGNFKAGRSM